MHRKKEFLSEPWGEIPDDTGGPSAIARVLGSGRGRRNRVKGAVTPGRRSVAALKWRKRPHAKEYEWPLRTRKGYGFPL